LVAEIGQLLDHAIEVGLEEVVLAFNFGEFAIIDSEIVDRFPDSEKLDGFSVPQPIGNKKITILGFEHIRERDEGIPLGAENRDFPALNLDCGFFGFGHGLKSQKEESARCAVASRG
jgi:hypothetical protein